MAMIWPYQCRLISVDLFHCPANLLIQLTWELINMSHSKVHQAAETAMHQASDQHARDLRVQRTAKHLTSISPDKKAEDKAELQAYLGNIKDIDDLKAIAQHPLLTTNGYKNVIAVIKERITEIETPVIVELPKTAVSGGAVRLSAAAAVAVQLSSDALDLLSR